MFIIWISCHTRTIIIQYSVLYNIKHLFYLSLCVYKSLRPCAASTKSLQWSLYFLLFPFLLYHLPDLSKSLCTWYCQYCCYLPLGLDLFDLYNIISPRHNSCPLGIILMIEYFVLLSFGLRTILQLDLINFFGIFCT